MFSLRNAVHAARRQGETPHLSSSARLEIQQKGRDAVLALCDSLSDGSALFRHEICFVFGELAHASCVPAMLRVLSDEKEHEMVRHEAAEALGAVVEEGDDAEVEQAQQQDAAAASSLSLTEQVMKELKRWAEDLEAPRVVRESCIVALDEMACELARDVARSSASGRVEDPNASIISNSVSPPFFQTTTTHRSSSQWTMHCRTTNRQRRFRPHRQQWLRNRRQKATGSFGACVCGIV